ncbi:hypothetical protein GC177_07855 [bacterium]|nr:hypothetical protein [bacterium]
MPSHSNTSFLARLRHSGGNLIQAAAEWHTGYDERVGISGSIIQSHPSGDAPGTDGLTLGERKGEKYHGPGKLVDESITNDGWWTHPSLYTIGSQAYASAASIVTPEGRNIFTYDDKSGFFYRHYDIVKRGGAYDLQPRETPTIIDKDVMVALNNAIYDLILDPSAYKPSAKQLMLKIPSMGDPITAEELFRSCAPDRNNDFEHIAIAVLCSNYGDYFYANAGKHQLFSSHKPMLDDEGHGHISNDTGMLAMASREEIRSKSIRIDTAWVPTLFTCFHYLEQGRSLDELSISEPDQHMLNVFLEQNRGCSLLRR